MRMTAASASAWFAALVLFTLPFSHSIALRLASLLAAWIRLAFASRKLRVPRIPRIPLAS